MRPRVLAACHHCPSSTIATNGANKDPSSSVLHSTKTPGPFRFPQLPLFLPRYAISSSCLLIPHFLSNHELFTARSSEIACPRSSVLRLDMKGVPLVERRQSKVLHYASAADVVLFPSVIKHVSERGGLSTSTSSLSSTRVYIPDDICLWWRIFYGDQVSLPPSTGAQGNRPSFQQTLVFPA